MRFDQKLMNYAIGEELTKTKIKNCRIMIERQFSNGCTPLQLVTMQSILKTMKKRIEKNYSDLLEWFDYCFDDILQIRVN